MPYFIDNHYRFYNHIACELFHIRTQSQLLVVFALVLLLSQLTFAQTRSVISIPAEFVSQLSLPGNSDHLLRPDKIFFDKSAGELFVVDRGHNRVVIFGENGIYRFEISMNGRCGSIADLAVSSEGYIYVLGSTNHGRRIFRFDFDGLYLGEVTLPEEFTADSLQFSGIAIDGHDRLYLQVQNALRIIRLAADGSFDISISITAQANEDPNLQTSVGPITVSGDNIYLPFPASASVGRYTLDGEFINNIGQRGTTTGGMAFPVAVTAMDNGMVLVLDKQRFNVQCYTDDGKFVGEFGGKGPSPGWFFYPSRIEAISGDQVYVGQVYQNRVQALRIPKAIQERFLEMRPLGLHLNHPNNNIESQLNRTGSETISGSVLTFHNILEVCYAQAAAYPGRTLLCVGR